MYSTLEVQWDIYVSCGRNICLGAYANNAKLCIPVVMVTLLIAVSSYEVCILTWWSDICTQSNGIYVAFEGHICSSRSRGPRGPWSPRSQFFNSRIWKHVPKQDLWPHPAPDIRSWLKILRLDPPISILDPLLYLLVHKWQWNVN